ncbi:MAG: hypothetical protein KDA89_02770 [Planctomycetaceae bacterium]|nr:hypothetical protein [Planctomycetaceae bacterium]
MRAFVRQAQREVREGQQSAADSTGSAVSGTGNPGSGISGSGDSGSANSGTATEASAASTARSPSTAPSLSADMEGALLRTLDGIREDLTEIAVDAASNDSGSLRTAVRNAPPRSGGSGDGMRSRLSRWTEAASDFLEDTAGASASPPAPSTSPQTGGGAAGSGVPNAGFLWLTVVAAVLVAALLLRRVLRSAEITAEARRRQSIRPERIQARDDVVAAFHKLALHPTFNAERWWTHRRAAGRIRDNSPERDEAVRVLTSLYEQARYQPQDTPFTDEQLELARQMVRKCLTT